jgi:hypothetical protein
MKSRSKSKPNRKPIGSTTNASDAMDDIELRPDAPPDEVVDVGVKQTFPASDPPAVQEAFEIACRREQRLKRGAPPDETPKSPPKRSPDWMTDKH